MNCPDCQGPLEGRKLDYRCPACAKQWSAEFTCETCGSEPEVISGCGSVSFFCPECRSLKSRESLNVRFTPREEPWTDRS